MPRLFVLDAMGLAYRSYHAIRTRRAKTDDELRQDEADEQSRAAAEGRPPRRVDPFRWEPLKNRRGEPTNAIHGFANTVLKIRRDEKPDYWALAWDGPGPTARHHLYADYKAHRPPTPDDLLVQIPAIEDLARALGLPVIEVPGQEADDVMATLAVRGARDGFDVVLVTSDKDMLPLIGERVRLWGPAGRSDEYVWTDRAGVEAKWGVPPEQIRDVLALMGDSVDNVPGVPGVGEKTAVELLRQFGSIDGLYARLDEVKRESLRRKLVEHREQLMLSRELVTVKTDCELDVPWESLLCGPVRRDDLLALARRYDLARLERLAQEVGVPPGEAGTAPIGRDPGRRGTVSETPAAGVRLAIPAPRTPASATAAPAAPATKVDAPARSAPGAKQASLDLWGPADPVAVESLASIVERLHEVRARSIHGVAILPVAGAGDPRRARLAGLALAALDGTRVYVPLAHAAGPNLAPDRAREYLAPLLADPATPKTGHDLKRDLHVLAGAGFALDGLEFDVHLGSFLLDPERDHGLGALARDVLGVALPEPDAQPRAARDPAGLAVPAVAAWAEAGVAALVPVAAALREQLAAREQTELYRTLEHPLIAVLREMESTGIRVDRSVLEAMSARAGAEMARLEAELFALAGGPLNLNSGPQLARVLFETLGLKPSRRTKTGFSTDQAVLEELAGAHAFPARLLEYRAVSKLKSTYLDALPQVVDPRDGRVHTTFHQAGAATGRLSSSDPNLQNIPMRSPQGREIRRAFVAAPGCALVGADYSQIELRVMAHLSGDPNLIEAFEKGEDVHASTARRIFGVTGELDPALRARAKIVNFGIMYGMGARSLSAQMGIGLADAQEFIRSYFRVFARVRAFLDGTVEEARRRGWVQTLFGRRRYLPGLDGGGAARAMAERVAINTPIQGSAADLVKLAMERVHGALKRSIPSARLLLQVHDELLLECAADDADAVEGIVRSEMEGCFPLRVPLVVSVGRGPTWFDVH